jgi:hypothetical protein
VKRVLLDENLPRKLRRDLNEFSIRTVQEENWTSFANGELLVRAQDRFDVLLTADRRLQFQQNLARFNIGVVVILTVSLQYRRIRVAIEDIRHALVVAEPRQLLHVQIP